MNGLPLVVATFVATAFATVATVSTATTTTTVAAATTTATVATATAAITTTAAAAVTTATLTGRTRFGCVGTQDATLEFAAIDRLDGGIQLAFVADGDEAEAF